MKRFRQALGFGAILLGGVGAAIWMLASPLAASVWVIAALAVAAIWVNLGKDIRTYAFLALGVLRRRPLHVLPGPVRFLARLPAHQAHFSANSDHHVRRGHQLSLADFKRAFSDAQGRLDRHRRAVRHHALARFCPCEALWFSREVAAGVVLIGSCPSGIASNVMAYISAQCRALGTITCSPPCWLP